MLRQLALLGRSSGAAWPFACSSGSASSQCVRGMASQPGKMTLEQYVADMRANIADAYSQRVEKYDQYVSAFEKYVATSGLPRANDFEGVKKFAQKRADMLKQVRFPDDWKVDVEGAEKIKKVLAGIPAEKKAAAEKGVAGKWYLKLSDAQVAECQKNPQLFVELGKMNDFEEMFNSASQAQGSKFGLPAVTLDELPPTMDPMGEYTISAEEVKWIMNAAKESATRIKTTDPRFADPYNTEEFKQEQARVADKLGISADKLSQMQAQMTPEKWKAVHA